MPATIHRSPRLPSRHSAFSYCVALSTPFFARKLSGSLPAFVLTLGIDLDGYFSLPGGWPVVVCMYVCMHACMQIGMYV